MSTLADRLGASGQRLTTSEMFAANRAEVTQSAIAHNKQFGFDADGMLARGSGLIHNNDSHSSTSDKDRKEKQLAALKQNINQQIAMQISSQIATTEFLDNLMDGYKDEIIQLENDLSDLNARYQEELIDLNNQERFLAALKQDHNDSGLDAKLDAANEEVIQTGEHVIDCNNDLTVAQQNLAEEQRLEKNLTEDFEESPSQSAAMAMFNQQDRVRNATDIVESMQEKVEHAITVHNNKIMVAEELRAFVSEYESEVSHLEQALKDHPAHTTTEEIQRKEALLAIKRESLSTLQDIEADGKLTKADIISQLPISEQNRFNEQHDIKIKSLIENDSEIINDYDRRFEEETYTKEQLTIASEGIDAAQSILDSAQQTISEWLGFEDGEVEETTTELTAETTDLAAASHTVEDQRAEQQEMREAYREAQESLVAAEKLLIEAQAKQEALREEYGVEEAARIEATTYDEESYYSGMFDLYDKYKLEQINVGNDGVITAEVTDENGRVTIETVSAEDKQDVQETNSISIAGFTEDEFIMNDFMQALEKGETPEVPEVLQNIVIKNPEFSGQDISTLSHEDFSTVIREEFGNTGKMAGNILMPSENGSLRDVAAKMNELRNPDDNVTPASDTEAFTANILDMGIRNQTPANMSVAPHLSGTSSALPMSTAIPQSSWVKPANQGSAGLAGAKDIPIADNYNGAASGTNITPEVTPEDPNITVTSPAAMSTPAVRNSALGM